MNILPYYKTNNCALYQCDNLELLKQLPEKYIDLIYCDILYNTGRKFDEYNDNLGTSEVGRILKVRPQYVNCVKDIALAKIRNFYLSLYQSDFVVSRLT